MMSTLFVILLYSSGMPVLYLVGAFFFAFTFYSNKMLILKYYRTSLTLSRNIPLFSIKIIKYGVFLHLAIGVFMMTNPEPFYG